MSFIYTKFVLWLGQCSVHVWACLCNRVCTQIPLTFWQQIRDINMSYVTQLIWLRGRSRCQSNTHSLSTHRNTHILSLLCWLPMCLGTQNALLLFSVMSVSGRLGQAGCCLYINILWFLKTYRPFLYCIVFIVYSIVLLFNTM